MLVIYQQHSYTVSRNFIHRFRRYHRTFEAVFLLVPPPQARLGQKTFKKFQLRKEYFKLWNRNRELQGNIYMIKFVM